MSSRSRTFSIEQTAKIVAAYVSRNAVPGTGLSALIVGIHAAVEDLQGSPVPPASATPLPTAAQIEASVRPDHIVSFLDGGKYQVLKRHLTTNGLTPERYRSRFALPIDYPMVASGYALRRSDIAKRIGLGQKVT